MRFRPARQERGLSSSELLLPKYEALRRRAIDYLNSRPAISGNLENDLNWYLANIAQNGGEYDDFVQGIRSPKGNAHHEPKQLRYITETNALWIVRTLKLWPEITSIFPGVLDFVKAEIDPLVMRADKIVHKLKSTSTGKQLDTLLEDLIMTANLADEILSGRNEGSAQEFLLLRQQALYKAMVLESLLNQFVL